MSDVKPSWWWRLWTSLRIWSWLRRRTSGKLLTLQPAPGVTVTPHGDFVLIRRLRPASRIVLPDGAMGLDKGLRIVIEAIGNDAQRLRPELERGDEVVIAPDAPGILIAAAPDVMLVKVGFIGATISGRPTEVLEGAPILLPSSANVVAEGGNA